MNLVTPKEVDLKIKYFLMTRKESRLHNKNYKKLTVQWLNEHFCSVVSGVYTNSFCLRNRQLIIDAKR